MCKYSDEWYFLRRQFLAGNFVLKFTLFSFHSTFFFNVRQRRWVVFICEDSVTPPLLVLVQSRFAAAGLVFPSVWC
jgi:hypothetical protein